MDRMMQRTGTVRVVLVALTWMLACASRQESLELELAADTPMRDQARGPVPQALGAGAGLLRDGTIAQFATWYHFACCGTGGRPGSDPG